MQVIIVLNLFTKKGSNFIKIIPLSAAGQSAEVNGRLPSKFDFSFLSVINIFVPFSTNGLLPGYNITLDH